MDAVAFLCKPTRKQIGYPERAQVCGCEDQRIKDPLDPDHCERCGHFTQAAIDEAWSREAQLRAAA